MLRRSHFLITSSSSLKSFLTDPEWKEALAPTLRKPYFKEIERFIDTESKEKGKTIFPPRKHIFTALNVCPLSKVKVVLIGQDPYHDDGQAHGLCFSVLPGVKTPPSLLNVYKELENEKLATKFKRPTHGYLMSWATQGILMLNASLTVEAHKANSHQKIGWQQFTDDVIEILLENRNNNAGKSSSPLVFLLWGNFAKNKAKMVDRSRHCVIENAHPSPLSAYKWFGCRCFSKCNKALVEFGEKPIDWRLPDEIR